MTVHLAVRAGREQVHTLLGGLAPGEQASVGPTTDRWCGVVLPPAADAGATASAVSEALGVPVLRVLADGDALDLHLYVYGEEIVAHGAAQGAMPAPGVVERLIDATDARALPDDLTRALTGRYPGPAGRYAAVVRLLGLPGYLVAYLDGDHGGDAG